MCIYCNTGLEGSRSKYLWHLLITAWLESKESKSYYFINLQSFEIGGHCTNKQNFDWQLQISKRGKSRKVSLKATLSCHFVSSLITMDAARLRLKRHLWVHKMLLKMWGVRSHSRPSIVSKKINLLLFFSALNNQLTQHTCFSIYSSESLNSLFRHGADCRRCQNPKCQCCSDVYWYIT